MSIKVLTKRVYDSAEDTDGMRVLIDRIWPRGVSKEAAKIDYWAKDLAPSDELRKWYRHDHEKWEEFKSRYECELVGKQNSFDEFLDSIHDDVLTLVYSSKEMKLNNATAFKEYLVRHLTCS